MHANSAFQRASSLGTRSALAHCMQYGSARRVGGMRCLAVCALALVASACSSDDSTTGSTDNAIWPANATQMVVTSEGGGFAPPAPTGSACQSGQASFTLTVATRNFAWAECQTSGSGPLHVHHQPTRVGAGRVRRPSRGDTRRYGVDENGLRCRQGRPLADGDDSQRRTRVLGRFLRVPTARHVCQRARRSVSGKREPRSEPGSIALCWGTSFARLDRLLQVAHDAAQ
jgi:hypothetical protein